MNAFPEQLLKNSPSGFPDMGGGEAIAQNRVLDVIRKHYERAGYSPLETSIVERPEILSAKSDGEISNQVYGLRLMNPTADSPDDAKDLALRFDHTVPLARYVAAHYGELTFPYRRYAIGPVFRGERARDGRYRQFTQADIDVIGDGTLSIFHDAEMVSVLSGIFSELEIGEFTVRIGNRKVLQGLLTSFGFTGEFSQASGVIDKLDKIGKEKVVELLISLGMVGEKAAGLLDLLTREQDVDSILAALKEKEMNPVFAEGVEELSQMIFAIRALGVPDERFRIDPSIARGLEYYTGTVFETTLNNHAEIGSIASGGRYDDLTGSFINRSLPGVGVSIGVTRLLKRLFKAGLVRTEQETVASVLITVAENVVAHGEFYFRLAKALRDAGVNTEMYLGTAALDKQMSFANKKGIPIVVIAKEEQIQNRTVTVRNMTTGDQQEIPSEKLVEAVQALLR
jgi:histidyl-tRNA synthetase